MTWFKNFFKNHKNDNKQVMPEKSLVPKNLVDWKLLGRLPMARVIDIDVSKINRINRYLTYQELRLERAAQEKQFNKVVLIWCMLLKNSLSYQTVLFNKVRPDWYRNYSERDALRLLQRIANKCRRWDLKLMLKRFYIQKPNGKWRPIGAPSPDSSAISRAFNDMIYFVFIDKFATYQHGFRIKRGTHTALFEVWHKTQVEGYKSVMEFDFVGYFNTVRPMWIYRYLLSRSKHLAELMIKIIYNIHYQYEEIKPERELKIIGKVREEYVAPRMHKQRQFLMEVLKHTLILKLNPHSLKILELLLGWIYGIKCKKKNEVTQKLRDLIVREGMPQGLSISPLLSTLVIEQLKAPEGLVMYADDGLHLSKEGDHSSFLRWVEQIGYLGITLAPDKSGIVKEGRFKFLGVIWDLHKQTVTYREHTKTWAGKDVTAQEVQQEMSQWFQMVAAWYGKKSKGWYWDIHKGSYAKRHYSKLPFFTTIKTVMYSWWTGKALNGHRYFIGCGIYEITKLSTLCCCSLINEHKALKLRSIKPLNLVEDGKVTNWTLKKNDYFEEIFENRLRAFTRESLPDWPNVHETLSAID